MKKTKGYTEDIYVHGELSPNTWRHDLIAKSREVTMCARLQHNFFNCSKLLIPNTKVQVRLDRTMPDFCLYRTKGTTDTYKIDLRECTLFMRKVVVSPPVHSAIEHRLATQAAVYPYMRVEMADFLIPYGTSAIKQDRVFTDHLPTRIFFAVCPTISLKGGSYDNNPMIFSAADYGVNFCQFYINDMPVLSRAYQPDFSNKDYVMSYFGMLRALRTVTNCPVSYDNFGGTQAFFCFDLSPDQTNLMASAKGNLSVEVRFKRNLREAINGVLFGEFRSCVSIDKNHNVEQYDL